MVDVVKHGVNYNPNFFMPGSFEDAKRIVLGHGIVETPSKWAVETLWIENMLRQRNFVNEDSVVLDWGVGVGRISKMLIDKFGCQVVGVDINNKLLDYAISHVASDKFTGMLVEDLPKLNKKFTQVIAIWALQHSVFISKDLDSINNVLDKNADIFIFETIQPTVPIHNSEQPWFILNDPYLPFYKKRFSLIEMGLFPSELRILENDSNCYWAFFKNDKPRV